MSLPLSQLGPLGLGLAWAVVCDLRRRRIPNVVAASVFVVGLGMRGFDGGFRALLSGLAAAVLLFILLYGAWRAGAIGGGDVKLAAATGAWVGLAGLPWFVLSTMLAGGVVAGFCYLLARAPARAEVRANVILTVLHGEMPPIASHRRGHPSVPYAVAIAAGAAVALVVV